MPSRAPKVCGLCGGVHPFGGERCAKAVAATRERKARADARRPPARQRGYDAEWVKLRREHLAAHPYCKRCGEPASVVDHVVTIRKAPHRRLDPSNLQSLCTPCHSSHKQRLDRAAGESS